jgi:exosome complex RNA-binding protein Csl4
MTYETISLIPQKTFSNTGVHSMIAIVVAITLVIGVCAVGPSLPPRPVGTPVELVGEVTSVSKEAYAVRIVLKIHEASPTFNAGDVEVTFTGIGDVSKWRAYGLKPGDIIRVTVRFVENSYWEALDSEWNYQ